MSKRHKAPKPPKPSASKPLPFRPLAKEFTLTVEMDSDWHIGSGAGRPGEVDRLVQRDRHDLPYIPAKTLTGIWRDACEQVAYGLDDGNPNGTWAQWVTYLFGSQPALLTDATAEAPCPAALSVRSAHLPEKLRQALTNQPRLKEALTFVKPGIAIDPQTGCTKPDFLRFEEMVRGGTILQAEKCQLQLTGTEVQNQAASALLIAGTKLVERLGAKRRRGAGRCKLVVGANLDRKFDDLIQWLQANPNPPAPSWKNSEATSDRSAFNPSAEWQRIPIEIETLSPLIVPSRTVGNVVESLDYIPGTQLLKLIIQKLKGHNIRLDRAIAENQIVVTNATLKINRQSGKPVPLSLYGTKLSGGLSSGGTVYNRLAESEPDEQLKGERSGYVGDRTGDQFSYGKVPKIITTHNTISDAEQRPISGVGGGVYSYEAIAAGTHFQAELRLPIALTQQLQKDWWKRLEGRAQLGQSKKDDYGAVKISVGKPEPCRSIASPSQTLTVWLLSDLLLRNDRLRPTTAIAALQTELQAQLGRSLTLRQAPDHLLHWAMREHRTESWQVRWGLPRPSMAGLAAGSCVVFEVEGAIDPAELLRLEVEGIGERRAEGYGQVCFNDPLLTKSTSGCTVDAIAASPESFSSDPLKSSKDSFAHDYARIIERAAWREAIRRSSLAFASDDQNLTELFGQPSDRPSMSQLGALRSILRRPEEVLNWLDHLEAIDNRQEKWPGNSLEAIRTLIASRQIVWQRLDLPIELTVTENAASELQDELWSEAVYALVDNCIRAHKRSLESDLSTTFEVVHGTPN